MSNTGVLLPYQKRWINDNSAVKICEKSRRIGLTWAEAAKSTLIAAQTTGQNTWYIGYNKDMTEQFIRDCTFWAKHYQVAASACEEVVLDDEDKDILTYRIRFASGNMISALSSAPRNLRSKKGRVIIDEAAFHDHLDEMLAAALALVIWGGSVSIMSTHFGVDNPFNTLIQDIREGKKPYSLHRITFDDAVNEGLCQRIFLTLNKKWSKKAQRAWIEEIRSIYRPNDAEELDCIASKSGGVYLSRAIIESRMSDQSPVLLYRCDDDFVMLAEPVREGATRDWLETNLTPILTSLPKGVISSVGQDFGRTGDLSVLAPLLTYKNLVRKAPFLLEMRNVPFEQQKQIFYWVCERLPNFSHGALDARGNGQYLAEVAMQRFGSTCISQVMLSAAWYLINMPKLKAAFEDGTLEVIPNDADTLTDLRAIVMDKGIPKVPDKAKSKSLKDGGQRHGDAAIAYCLAWYASLQQGTIYEYMDVPRNARHNATQKSKNFMRPDHSRDQKPRNTDRRGW